MKFEDIENMSEEEFNEKFKNFSLKGQKEESKLEDKKKNSYIDKFKKIANNINKRNNEVSEIKEKEVIEFEEFIFDKNNNADLEIARYIEIYLKNKCKYMINFNGDISNFAYEFMCDLSHSCNEDYYAMRENLIAGNMTAFSLMMDNYIIDTIDFSSKYNKYYSMISYKPKFLNLYNQVRAIICELGVYRNLSDEYRDAVINSVSQTITSDFCLRGITSENVCDYIKEIRKMTVQDYKLNKEIYDGYKNHLFDYKKIVEMLSNTGKPLDGNLLLSAWCLSIIIAPTPMVVKALAAGTIYYSEKGRDNSRK